jgi:hypothetical protein
LILIYFPFNAGGGVFSKIGSITSFSFEVLIFFYGLHTPALPSLLLSEFSASSKLKRTRLEYPGTDRFYL